jgi:hypothetical protein
VVTDISFVTLLYVTVTPLVTDIVTDSQSLTLQTNKYLGMVYDYLEDSLAFWLRNKGILDKLFVPALAALSIPASSAPVERIFSFSGIFMRPHRSRLSDKNLSALTYLRCNNNIK